MSRLNRFSLAGLLLLSGLCAPVQATTFTTLTLEQQAKKAEVIVQATIGTPTSVTEAGRTYAVYPLKVSETLAGDAAQLPQTGGTQGGGGPALYVLSGMDQGPVFQAGQEAVLLLYKARLDSPLVGFNQGAYLVSNGQVSVLMPVVAPTQGTFPAPNGPTFTPDTAATVPVVPATAGTPTPASTAPLTPVSPAAPATVATPTAPTTPPPTTSSPTTPPAPTSAGTPAAVTSPPGSSAAPTSSVPGSAPASVPTPGSVPPAASPVFTAPPTTGVLGKIRTAAELKAAIVAARAAK